MYVGFIAVLTNLVVAVLVTLLCRALRAADGVDRTRPDDYLADEGDARATPPTEDQLPEPVPTA
jgi:SSS family solute:Na+ symporter